MRMILLLALALVDVRTADACATAPPEGAGVRIAEEEALIIWDPATKTEHFIRRAAFHSTAPKFGFLVPTPTVPQLGEVSNDIFSSLANLIRPELQFKEVTRYKAGSWMFEACVLSAGDKKDAAPLTAAEVRVLGTATVAGFNATVVEADDANALTQWLGQHGFEATPHLTKWLERYVADKWKITAFVIASGEPGATRYDMSTKAVKMTFPAERPFYPYREPQIEMTVETDAKLAPPDAARMLRVYFASTERYAATHGDKPWSAKVLQAGKINAPDDLAALIGPHSYMTVFVDESSPRRGLEELYFAPSADKSDVKQPAVILEDEDVTIIPVDFILLALGVVGYVIVRRRRRR